MGLHIACCLVFDFGFLGCCFSRLCFMGVVGLGRTLFGWYLYVFGCLFEWLLFVLFVGCRFCVLGALVVLCIGVLILGLGFDGL